MAKTTSHPVLGRLIPDQWGDELMFFRKFPFMEIFWFPDSEKQLEDLELKHRDLVKKWDQQPGGLPEFCRNFDVMTALQSLGVFEVGISNEEDPEILPPTDAQVSAWEFFVEHEEQICRNACDSLVRYYNFFRKSDPQLFEEEDDCPEIAETIKDLQSCIRFDGINFSPAAIPGLSTISFGWDVDWDMEHGLQTIFHEGEVIAIGNDLYSPEDILSDSNFGKKILTETEQAALKNFEVATKG